MKSGRCRIKTKYIHIYLNLGRGKRFNFKFITNYKVLVYKKGIDLYMSDKEFYRCFEILNR